MAEVQVRINYNCGCGFKTNELTEAANHCLQTGHQLSVLGTIKSNKGV